MWIDQVALRGLQGKRAHDVPVPPLALTRHNTWAFKHQITVTKTYNVTNLFEDIKALYKIAGGQTALTICVCMPQA